MILIEFHLGLRQVFMALMNWAIDVPQKLLQNDAKLFLKMNYIFIYLLEIKFYFNKKYKIIERLIIHLF
jgi:hypothetical protein